MKTLEYPKQSAPSHMLIGMALSGKRINLLDIRPEDIQLEDIIFNLSRSPRYNAATTTVNAVQITHHLRMCKAVYREMVADGYADYSAEFEAQLWFHDSPEGIVQDIVSPLKRALRNSGQLQLYSDMTDCLEHAIYSRVGLHVPTPEEHAAIKNVDLYAMSIEQIMHRPVYNDRYSDIVDKQYPDYTYVLLERPNIKQFLDVTTPEIEWERAVEDLFEITANLPSDHPLAQQLMNIENPYSSNLDVKMAAKSTQFEIDYPPLR